MLDLVEGGVVSSKFGSIPQIVMRGSDMTTFELLPGENAVRWFSPYDGAGAVGAGTAYLSWRGKHWGMDGAA
jgi:hypothetical protein